jgi:hypothetical protein
MSYLYTDVDECVSTPCIHGNCTDGLGTYSCTCHAGFTGGDCDKDVDDCLGSLCENGGACVDAVDGYTCACLPTYTGQHCEIAMGKDRSKLY